MRFMQMLTVTLSLLLSTATLVHAAEIVVDNDDGAPGYSETGEWLTSSSTGYNGGTYRYYEAPGGTARWIPNIPSTGVYEVVAIFRRSNNRPENVIYTISHATGQSNIGISQRGSLAMVEVSLGSYSFPAGFNPAYSVLLSSSPTDSTIADAIAFRSSEPGEAPNIADYVRMPGKVDDDTVVSIRGDVSYDGSLTSVGLTYTVFPGGLETTVEAFDDGLHGDQNAGDSVYGAFIPPQPDGSRVDAFLQAWDTFHQEGRSQTRSYYVGRYPEKEFRAVWADSWNVNFLNPSQAQDLVNTARAANINVIMPEVRKVGDAYYDSAYEPRATNISGGPSFDPLQYIIDLAHDTSGGKKRVQIHAWFVMNRIANSSYLDPSHVLIQHPEYEMLKRDGTHDTTRYLDPGHPGAVDHNVAVILDCLSKYDIDGYHFDYIRYPEISGEWGYNAVSMERFNTIHNRIGTPQEWDPLWQAWRRECVSLMVKKIYVKAWQMKPHVLLTAATVNWGWSYDDFTQSSAYRQVFQDWEGWLQDGIIDYNSLMSYSSLSDPARHQGWSWLSIDATDIRGSIIGVGVYLSSNLAGAMDSFHYARSSGADGLNIYDWGSEVQNNNEGATRQDFYTKLKDEVFPTWVEPPTAPWKSNPITGIYEGNVTFDGDPVDHARVRIVGMPETETVTDGSGWYGILHVPPGNHVLEVVKDGVGAGTQQVTTSIPNAGDIITVDVALDNTGVDDWGLY